MADRAPWSIRVVRPIYIIRLRLEVRDFAYSGYVSQVNGCNLQDVQFIEQAESQQPPTRATGLSSGCNESAFGPLGQTAKLNASGAKDLLAKPSAEVINNIAFQGGVSWLF